MQCHDLGTMTLNLFWIRFVAYGLLGASFPSPCWGQEQKSPTATPSPTSQRIGLIDQVAALQREVETLKQKIASLETAGPPSSPGLALPVGSIVSYWGSLDELPKGYELCDGELVTTPDSPINGKRKPNLVDSFLKGALKGVSDVRANPETGGSNSKDITHSHPAGNLRALVGATGYFIKIQERGGLFTATREISANGFSPPGGYADYGTAIEGETAPAKITIDGRPNFVSIFYIIKVK